MISIDPDEFDALRAHRLRAMASSLFDTYRIDQHTWYKLRDGRQDS